jgi:sarcosine/dimethylglycine N-methyltransferase
MTDERANRVKEIFNAYGVLTEAWGGDNIHLGIYLHPGEPHAVAAERANARLAEAAAVRPGESVLETACGVGGAARSLARRFGAQVVATNISEGQVELGRQRAHAEGLGDAVRFEVADFQALPFADASFDCYWCQDSWLYADDKEAVVTEAFRVLKPGGRVVVTEFVQAGTLPPDFERELLAAVGTPGFWPGEAYEAALDRAGFTGVSSEDWSQHAVPSWENVLAALLEARESFVSRLGSEMVEATITRFELWLRAFQGGHLGWRFFAARKEPA